MSTEPTTAATSEDRHRDDQHRAILSAASGLLASGGAEALRVLDIAEAAGCSTMGVYSRFGGKEGVLEAIFVDGFERFEDALRTELVEPIADQAQRLGRAYRQWALANPGPYKVMFTEAVPGFRPSDEARSCAAPSFDVLVAAVENAQNEGSLRAIDPVDIAWVLWGVGHGLVMLELADMNPDRITSDAERIYELAMTSTFAGFAAQ